MKYVPFLFLLFIIPATGICISVEEVGRLAELKTAEDLIVQVIEKEGVDRPLTAKDVIYLRERGISETLIDYLWKQSFQEKDFLPPQEGESKMIGENLRTYSSTDKAGNKVLVVTNLNEDGRRMGPPPPPRPEPAVVYEPEPPREIYVPVAQNQSASGGYHDEYPVQVYPSDSVGFSSFDSGFYPSYSYFTYPYYSSYSYFPVKRSHSNPHCFSGKSIGHGQRGGGSHRTGSRSYQQRPQRINTRGPVNRSTSAGKSAKY